MTFTFAAAVAWDPVGNKPVKNTSFQVYATSDTGYTTPLAITDPFNNPIAGNILNSGSQGVFPQFNQATNSAVVITDPAHTYAWTINAVMQDASVAAYINAAGSATQTALTATYAPLTSAVTTLTVKADGTGQFTSPKAANDSITNSGPNKPYLILVYPGVYTDAANWTPQPYVTIRGTNRDLCTLRYTVPVDSTDATINNTFVMEIHGTVALENLTIAIRNGKYAVHSEQAGNNVNAAHNIKNCVFIHEGWADVNTWRTNNPGSGLAVTSFNSEAAWGYGSASGVVETFTECTIKSPYGPFFGHNNVNFTAPTNNTLQRCRITTDSATAGGITINSLGSGQADTFTFTDCQLDTLYLYHTDATWGIETAANHLEFHITVDHCNPVGYFDDSRGKALMVTSGYGTAGALSTISVSGTAAPILFGTTTYRFGTGDAGFFAYAYGSQDISGITLGLDGHAGTINTLAKRLGNRTSAPITLTVTNEGFYSQSYTFNTDYTGMTDTAIINLVNTAWAGFVLGTFNPASERYMRVIGSESALNNTGNGIAQYTAVAYTTGKRGIRPFLTGDPASAFAGIALERIPKGMTGRILREGIMHKTQLAGLPATLAAPTLTLGTTSTTGGTLAAGATYWKLTAINTAGETVGSNEVTATLTGSTSSQPFTWTAIPTAAGYKLYRGTAAGAENVLVATIGTVTSYTDTGASAGAATVPTTNTASTIVQDGVIYQSDSTAGQFSNTGTRTALTGVATDWAYFKATA